MVETRPFLAFFEDRKRTLRITKLKRDNPVNAGKVSEKIVLWAKNITGNELLNVQISVNDKEVMVSPSIFKRIDKDEVVKVTFIWKPDINRKTALKTKLKSAATEVIRPR